LTLLIQLRTATSYYIEVKKMVSKVLLTGGSGFIASHVLDVLLKRGYTVVATVRSQDKGARIRANHPNAGSKLDFAIVEDIAQPTGEPTPRQ